MHGNDRGTTRQATASACLLVAWLTLAAGPASADIDCGLGPQPAATLLVPYFRVDLDAETGRTTLFAIGNAVSSPRLARVTLWTDWGYPSLGFDVLLAGDAVQTINLRDVFLGRLPTTSGSYPGCASPLSKPVLGVAELAALRARHTGLPDPGDGACYGSARGDGQARGFVTVDVLDHCPASQSTTPLTAGYFGARGTGIASDDNVLYGDFFLLDPANSYAQGNAAVHLPADPGRYASRSFYGDLRVASLDHRAPLASRYRTRFLAGTAFDAGTELIVFSPPSYRVDTPTTCGLRPMTVDGCQHLRFTARDESGGQSTAVELSPVTEVTASYRVGSPELDFGPPFGSVEVENLVINGCDLIPTGDLPLGEWVMPLYDASGRYSIGIEATRLETGCY